MKCIYCGSDIRENIRFCSKCGKRLLEDIPISENLPINNKPEDKESIEILSRSKVVLTSLFLSFAAAIGIFDLAIIIVFIVLVIVYLKAKRNNQLPESFKNTEVSLGVIIFFAVVLVFITVVLVLSGIFYSIPSILGIAVISFLLIEFIIRRKNNVKK